jgi:hypothetical protein
LRVHCFQGAAILIAAITPLSLIGLRRFLHLRPIPA